MNLLFFTHEKEYGGASRALITLIEDLKKDCNIYVVVPFKKAKIINELKRLDVNVINCFYSWWQYPKELGLFKKIVFKFLYRFNFVGKFILKRKIRKLNIDIIHSNTSVIDIGSIIAHELNIKHIWHFREFTGKHLDFVCGKEKAYKYINDSKDRIVYISKAIRDFYEKYINKELGVLIYDGIPKKYEIDKKYKKKSIITFLLASTLEKNKGQELCLKATYILKKDNINNFKLLLAGGNPSGYLDHLKDLIEKYNISNNVEYIGFVNNMNELRKNVDVELMCAPREAFGLVTAEAMLAGNAVIGSNSGATKEIVKDGITGYLYNYEDASDLAKKMKLIIENPGDIKKFGIEGKKRILNNFSSEKNYKKILTLYKEEMNDLSKN